MARAQVLDALDARDPAAPFQSPDSLLEHSLAATREDQRRLFGFVDWLVPDLVDLMLLPLGLSLRGRASWVERPIAADQSVRKRLRFRSTIRDQTRWIQRWLKPGIPRTIP